MGRPGKVKVDYFPHVTNTGKTIAILESRWGNDGYSFWFKLLELIGNTDGFCYNCNSPSDWEYLLSKTKVAENVAVAILNKLADIDAIDAELWCEKRVWSENFVAGVVPAFEKRKGAIPKKPDLESAKSNCREVSKPGNDFADKSGEFPGPETGRGEETNGEEIKEKETPPNPPAGFATGKTSDKKRHSKRNAQHPCPSMLREGVEAQADTVYLTPTEVERLSMEYGSDGMLRMVAILDAYKTNHPEKCAEYRDDYKVITSWVISRYLEERAIQQKNARAGPQGAGRKKTFIEQLADMAREGES